MDALILEREASMVTILTVYICIRGFCLEVYIPTPASFACDNNSYHEKYLAVEYPRWRYTRYICTQGGRDA
jgi:hypothetical protein